eukprot:CAMPEP_0183393244 /NCGR_PEP_ID=MMETSP0370-20130417/7815_1 /TAXON_ID=268820 /ORGANISM="Peridinium aciculiferum, Strain PAER-2" /LENGTH=225 /DNA_ID=CAMNT_0025573423 /DNA_START=10 /DNA_END=683 /DNA_ORIENTATION=-
MSRPREWAELFGRVSSLGEGAAGAAYDGGDEPEMSLVGQEGDDLNGKDRGASKMLREMMQELSEFAGMAQVFASLARGSAAAASTPTPAAHGFIVGALPDQPVEGSCGPDVAPGWQGEEVSEDATFVPSAVQVQIALRVESLLACPFVKAVRLCSALRKHLERARSEQDDDDDEDVEDDFRNHWHTEAPEDLRKILQQLLYEDVEGGVDVEPSPCHAEGPHLRSR